LLTGVYLLPLSSVGGLAGRGLISAWGMYDH